MIYVIIDPERREKGEGKGTTLHIRDSIQLFLPPTRIDTLGQHIALSQALSLTAETLVVRLAAPLLAACIPSTPLLVLLPVHAPFILQSNSGQLSRRSTIRRMSFRER